MRSLTFTLICCLVFTACNDVSPGELPPSVPIVTPPVTPTVPDPGLPPVPVPVPVEPAPVPVPVEPVPVPVPVEPVPIQPLPDTQPPVVAIRVTQTAVTVGDTVTVHVEATDNTDVRSVELRQDNLKVASQTGNLLDYSLKTSVTGTFTLTAVALDSAGNMGTSESVIVTVTALPALPSAAELAQQAVAIQLPTQDGKPSVRHPDVHHFEQPWNGYEYWMAFTPYPGPERENPSIAASKDGVNWEVPSGAATSEIVSLATTQASGYQYASDTDLVLTPANTLRMYYRTAQTKAGIAREGIWMTESGDGRSWSPPRELFTVISAPPADKKSPYAYVLSPAVVVGPDGVWRMWSVNRYDLPGTVELRTSSDGLTWSAPVTTQYGGDVPWHPDVVYRAGQYVMLMQEASQKLMILTSKDGLAWHKEPALQFPYFPLEYFNEAHYRSALVPSDKPGYWDVYLSGYKSSSLESRLVLLKGLHLTP